VELRHPSEPSMLQSHCESSN